MDLLVGLVLLVILVLLVKSLRRINPPEADKSSLRFDRLCKLTIAFKLAYDLCGLGHVVDLVDFLIFGADFTVVYGNHHWSCLRPGQYFPSLLR